MKTILHQSETRGFVNHGWLKSHHTFSFGGYRNPERMHFGVLRVLNDDEVAPGMGFGAHPHENMEIISIPLEGDLKHQDSMGNVAVIREGDVQVMSAGTGITHSEYNANADKAVKFLQIWLFPAERNVSPRYDQIALDNVTRRNELIQILSPNAGDEGVWIHQNAWFNLGNFDPGFTTAYQLHDPDHGIYLFVIDGEITVGDQSLHSRDGYGIWDTSSIEMKAESSARLLLMEVPMQLPRM